jgi:hypothetical protein
LNGIKR